MEVFPQLMEEKAMHATVLASVTRITAAGVLPDLPPSLPSFLLICPMLCFTDRRQRDVLALTLRGRRVSALGPEVVVDDYPEETKAQQARDGNPFVFSCY